MTKITPDPIFIQLRFFCFKTGFDFSKGLMTDFRLRKIALFRAIIKIMFQTISLFICIFGVNFDNLKRKSVIDVIHDVMGVFSLKDFYRRSLREFFSLELDLKSLSS